MFKVSSKGIISLTRGDSALLKVTVSDQGKPYTLQEGDSLALTVKRSTQTASAVVSKLADAEGNIRFNPSDTSGLPYGKYIYDVQLTKADGSVYTIIVPTEFNLLEEVTW